MSLLTCTFLIVLFGCTKTEINEQETIRSVKRQVVQQVPPEILLSVHRDYLEKGELKKAENLRNAYDFSSGISKFSAEHSLQSLNLYVPGVGHVLDGGHFVEYTSNTKAHIQKLGWVDYVFDNMNSSSAPHAFDNTSPSNGQYMGTMGEKKRMEAFVLPFVQYTNDGISKSDILVFKYRAHMQSLGWQPWVISNEVAGIPGQGLRLEAFEIILTQKYVPFPCLCLYQVKVYYRAHVEGIGWQPWVEDGQTAGTIGLAKRVEAMQIRVYFIP